MLTPHFFDANSGGLIGQPAIPCRLAVDRLSSQLQFVIIRDYCDFCESGRMEFSIPSVRLWRTP